MYTYCRYCVIAQFQPEKLVQRPQADHVCVHIDQPLNILRHIRRQQYPQQYRTMQALRRVTADLVEPVQHFSHIIDI